MAQFDNIIRRPGRLQIMSSLVALEQGEQIDFVYPRKILKLTECNSAGGFAKSKNTVGRK